MSAPTLRPYQEAQLAAVVAGMQSGQRRLLVKSPTGTGKTVMFSRMPTWPELEAFIGQHHKRGARMLVIAHREELLEQAAAKIQAANRGMIVMIEQADRVASPYCDVVVASIQTLQGSKFARLKRLMLRHDFTIVVVDEAHHSAAKTYRTALAHLGFLPTSVASAGEDIEAATHDDVAEMEAALSTWDRDAPANRLLVGVTATPNRSDAIGLGCVFQSIAYSYNLKDAISDGWLVPIVPWVLETDTSLEQVRTQAGDFNQKQLAVAVNNTARNQAAVRAWEEHALGLSTLAFTVDVQHAHDLAEAFQAAGHRFRALSGETPKDERRAMLAAYTAGDLEGITNCMVLTEGTDLPRTGCILHTKPTQSATLYEQMTGRGLRLFPDKRECIVIDLVDVARRHSLQTAGVLYGLPPGLLAKGKKLDQIEHEYEEFLEKYPGFEIDGRQTLEELRLKASTFDIWSVPSLGAFGNGRAMDWIKFGEDDFRLEYPWGDGKETISVQKDMLGHYTVCLTLRPHDNAPARQRTIAAQVATADAAAGLAEAFVLQERRSVTKLTANDAPWRAREASPKQIGLLAKLRVPTRKGMTAGEASNLINLAMARRVRR